MNRKKIMAKLLALSLTAATAVSSAAIPAIAGTVSENTISTYAAENADSYTYVYAGLTWNEYWASENVYAAGNTDSSEVRDSHGETDKGGFDAVTRATTNHGLHRGSYQSIAYVEDTEGNTHTVSYWKSGATRMGDVVMDDGKVYSADSSSGKLVFTCTADNTSFTMKDYKVTGIKYVPVAVKTSDYEAFKASYPVVENGGTLAGGYTEGKLSSYSVTANVTANTNGLKTATKNADGTFSFSARKNNGTDSGIQDQELKKAKAAAPTVKPGTGSYGEFLRVDINGDYGDLGANMQATQWTYYGNDNTYSKPLATYGTKFAADNWMHKSMGIQLGLTDSIRCQLPSGTDGTGYWRLTVYALGYEDYTYDFQATEDNIAHNSDLELDPTKMQALIAQADTLKEADYTTASWAPFKAELDESKEILENALAGADGYGQAQINEQIGHLTEAMNHLVALKHISAVKLNQTSASLMIGKTLSLKATVTPTDTTDDASVTYTSSNPAVASVDAKGKVTAKAAGSAVITASAG